MKIDLSKNLNELEGIVWRKPEYSSHLVIRCHELRVKKLSDYDIEDLRLMIGQNIGMDYLIPLAIQKLKEDILPRATFMKVTYFRMYCVQSANFGLNILNTCPK